MNATDFHGMCPRGQQNVICLEWSEVLTIMKEPRPNDWKAYMVNFMLWKFFAHLLHQVLRLACVTNVVQAGYEWFHNEVMCLW